MKRLTDRTGNHEEGSGNKQHSSPFQLILSFPLRFTPCWVFLYVFSTHSSTSLLFFLQVFLFLVIKLQISWVKQPEFLSVCEKPSWKVFASSLNANLFNTIIKQISVSVHLFQCITRSFLLNLLSIFYRPLLYPLFSLPPPKQRGMQLMRISQSVCECMCV